MKSIYGPCPNCGFGLVLDTDDNESFFCSNISCHFVGNMVDLRRIRYIIELNKTRKFRLPSSFPEKLLLIIDCFDRSGPYSYPFKDIKDVEFELGQHNSSGLPYQYELWHLDGKFLAASGGS